MLRRALVPLIAAAFCLHATGQGQVWIVDPAGGAGVDFTDLQTAIDTAADGDTLIARKAVWPGVYAPAVVDARSLVILREGFDPATSSIPDLPRIEIKNLLPGQEVVLTGLEVRETILEANDGLVWIEECILGGSLYFIDFFPCGHPLLAPATTGLLVHSSSSVVLSRCVARGGASGALDVVYPGIDLVDSTAHLYETYVLGGTYGSPDKLIVGAPGLRVEQSFLFSSGGEIHGGCGSPGGVCSPGAAGGPGLDGTLAGAPPLLLGTLLAGGKGGDSLEPWCATGPTGPDVLGPHDLVAGYPRDYALGSPVTGGGTTPLAYAGQPGDMVFSVIAMQPAAQYQPALAGTLAVKPPPLLISHGPVDAAGELHLDVPVPPVPSGFGVQVYAQGAAISAVGSAVLAAPSQLTIL